MIEPQPWLLKARIRKACGFSQWYITNDQKPWVPGVYQILKLDGHSTEYSHWDGERWGMNEFTEEQALKAFRSTWQNKRWRGLARDPQTVGEPTT